MADPTTVLQFATQKNTNLQAALTAAKTTAANTLAAVTAAGKARDDAKNALDATAADIAAVRAKLATAVSPEDIKALLAQLQTDITNWRHQTGTLSNKDRDLMAAKSNADVAASEVLRLTAAVTASAAALKDATAQDQRRAALKGARAAPPLATIDTDAKAVADGTAFVDPANKFKVGDALNRLKTDLTDALMQEAEHRLQDETARAVAASGEYLQAQLLVEAQQKSGGGPAGAVTAAQSAFTRAEAGFTAYVNTAATRFTKAKKWLAQVADPTNKPLTAAEAAAIQDATTVTNAGKGASAERAVIDAQAALAQAQAVLDEKLREDTAAGVDPSTPSAAVVQATKDRDTAKATLTTAQGNYTADLQAALAAWEVLVPDSEWQLMLLYEDALDTLNWLQTPGPTKLAGYMDTAEQALVTALLAADKNDTIGTALQVEVTRQTPAATFESTAAPGRRLSALRGDF
jgi:hypothetical protein